jgi:hypothetical protein
MTAGETVKPSRNSKLLRIAKAFCSAMLWILLFWAIWATLQEAIGNSGWPLPLRALIMGAVVGVASGFSTFVDRRLLHYDGPLTKFSVLHVSFIALFGTGVLYLAFDHSANLPPWFMALILLALIVVIAIFNERAQRGAKPTPQAN